MMRSYGRCDHFCRIRPPSSARAQFTDSRLILTNRSAQSYDGCRAKTRALLFAPRQRISRTKDDGLFVRFARRLANWEEPLSVDELQKREFKARDGGPDLCPSVYDVANRDETVQACAEYSTKFDPDRTTLGVDVTDAAKATRKTEGNPAFAFIRDHHREVLSEDADDLRTFIGALMTNLPERRHVVTRVDVFAYAKGRLQEEDGEWEAAVNADGAKSWLKKLRPR